jgi:hypothetical protein
VIVAVLSWALWATTQRYEVDYATLLLIGAFVVWAALDARVRDRRRARRTVAIAGIALTALGAAVGTAVSFTGYYDTLLLTHRSTFRALEDMTSPFAALATMIAGKAVLVRVDGPLGVDLLPPGYGTFGERGAGTWLGAGPVTVTVDAPRGEQLALRAVATPAPGGPKAPALSVIVQSPGQRAVAVPVVTGEMLLPIRLHWGLNRITLNLAGPKARSPAELYLASIVLH